MYEPPGPREPGSVHVGPLGSDVAACAGQPGATGLRRRLGTQTPGTVEGKDQGLELLGDAGGCGPSGALPEQGLTCQATTPSCLSSLDGGDGHLSVEEIWDHVRAGLPTVSLKPIYEALHKLEAVGETRLARFGTGSWRVELNPDHHHGHLVCDRCEAVCDVEADYPHLAAPRSERRLFVLGRAEVICGRLRQLCRRTEPGG